MSYTEPKLVFKKTVNPLVLMYGMEYGPDTFTPTGLRPHHIEPIEKWCIDNSCGEVDLDPLRYYIKFKREDEVAWFLLRWT